MAVDMSAQAIAVRKSTIPHLGAQLDLFATRKTRKCGMVEYYYGFPLFADMTIEDKR